MDRTTDCWLWRGKPTGSGYGNYQPKRGINLSTHKLSYELTYGAVPSGLVVRHSCDNKLCYKPIHLILGTQADNMRDKVARGRQALGSKHGMALTIPEEIMKLALHFIKCDFGSTEIAKRTGIPKTTINRIRNGKHWSQNGQDHHCLQD